MVDHCRNLLEEERLWIEEQLQSEGGGEEVLMTSAAFCPGQLWQLWQLKKEREELKPTILPTRQQDTAPASVWAPPRNIWAPPTRTQLEWELTRQSRRFILEICFFYFETFGLLWNVLQEKHWSIARHCSNYPILRSPTYWWPRKLTLFPPQTFYHTSTYPSVFYHVSCNLNQIDKEVDTLKKNSTFVWRSSWELNCRKLARKLRSLLDYMFFLVFSCSLTT